MSLGHILVMNVLANCMDRLARDPEKTTEDAQDIVVEQEERYRKLACGDLKDTLTGEVIEPFSESTRSDDYRERFPR